MMAPVHRISSHKANSLDGTVRLDIPKSVWNGIMIGSFIILAPTQTNIAAICLGIGLTYITLLFGHSIGMHRMMIHRSFKAKSWLKYFLIYLGTLVGIGGPTSIIKIHDIRDWAQRAPYCHDFFSHRRSFLRDLSWQLFYKFDFVHPPKIEIEAEISDNRFLSHLDHYWRLHQFGLACLLFILGGLPFVVWGICFRVCLSTIGHWTVTYICHNPGPGKWDVPAAGVQASNLRLSNLFGGWITHGECWHNNHHAFPESARIGLYENQIDPAAWLIEKMGALGLVWDVGSPREDIEDLALRHPLPKP
jgi:stearoyl-CoA desaturase (delta-9 desaturase)